MGLRGPRQQTPGLDLAGIVEEVGPGVEGFAVGDQVVGAGRGALAELAVTSAGRLAHKPASLAFEQAAAIPVSGVTALQGLRDVGRMTAGQSVLHRGVRGRRHLRGPAGQGVRGGRHRSGERGQARPGPRTSVPTTSSTMRRATCSTDEGCGTLRPRPRHQRQPAGARAAPAAHTARHTRHRRRGGRRLDPRRARAPAGGRGAVTVRPAPAGLLRREGQRRRRADPRRPGEQGKLHPAVERTFPLAEAGKALAHLQDGHVRGKVVVLP